MKKARLAISPNGPFTAKNGLCRIGFKVAIPRRRGTKVRGASMSGCFASCGMTQLQVACRFGLLALELEKKLRKKLHAVGRLHRPNVITT